MKKITLIRHAKSSWADLSLSDHERPLNKRGLRDAPRMASLLVNNGWAPQLFVCSTAKRAQETASFFLAAFSASKPAFSLNEDLYHASPSTILDVIQSLDDEVDHAVLFGHNPGFTDVSNYFIDNGYIDNLPTCGVVEIVGLEVDKWAGFNEETAKVKEVFYPKKDLSL